MTKKIIGAILAVSILALSSTAIAAEHNKKAKNPAIAQCKKEHADKKSAEYKACVKAAKAAAKAAKEAKKEEKKEATPKSDEAKSHEGHEGYEQGETK